MATQHRLLSSASMTGIPDSVWKRWKALQECHLGIGLEGEGKPHETLRRGRSEDRVSAIRREEKVRLGDRRAIK